MLLVFGCDGCHDILPTAMRGIFDWIAYSSSSREIKRFSGPSELLTSSRTTVVVDDVVQRVLRVRRSCRRRRRLETSRQNNTTPTKQTGYIYTGRCVRRVMYIGRMAVVVVTESCVASVTSCRSSFVVVDKTYDDRC